MSAISLISLLRVDIALFDIRRGAASPPACVYVELLFAACIHTYSSPATLSPPGELLRGTLFISVPPALRAVVAAMARDGTGTGFGWYNLGWLGWVFLNGMGWYFITTSPFLYCAVFYLYY
jgi:hypothetical protein